ncbi:MAG: AAA family ATPase, partial [Candidatus Omnitrophica bacterium]|nr:AAA family ATPase [Candidatus Omnitrophota bacterium]
MFLSYTVIFYPLYKLVNNRFKTLPLRVEDFFELFKPLDGKHIIRLPFASNTQGPFITSTTGNIIAGIGAVSTSAICGFIAYGAYISGLSTVLGWSGLIVFIGSSFLGSLALGYGISVILELCAVVLGESIFHPFIYLFKSLFPAVGHENFEKEMPYSEETIKLFEKYREQQKSAASFNRSISGDRDGAQDMASMLRDNKVSIEKERVVIDDITLPVKQGPPDVFVPDREDAKLINTVSTIRNMKKVAISLVLNEPVLLVGESGVGKTSIVRYLASITNRGFRRFNLNGQTEKTELIGGYRPDGDGNFKWVDGMLMHAMRDGHILVLDEINLAESQVLERINSLLDDDRHLTIPERNNTYWLDAGKYDLKLKEMMEKENLDAAKAGEMLAGQNIFRINENFRLVATMNPVEYAGRNILSPALMNRFKVKWIDEPYSLERQAIFNELFKDADGAPMLGWGVLDRIDWFHSRLKDFSMARRIGQDERDPYYYSIRDLLKLGGRIRAKIDKAEAATKKKLTPTERRAIVVREVVSVYADRIRSEEDRENVLGRINEVFDGTNEPLNYEIRTIGQGAVKIGDTVIRKRDGRGPYVPGASARLFETETTNKYLAKIAEMIEMKEMPLLVGPTGSAKTSLVRYLAYLTGNNFVRVNLDAQTDTSEIIGSYVPVENEEGKFEWRDGLLVTALKKGYWILLDELNLADPEILERINSLLDDEGCLVITEHENEKIMSPREYRGKIEEYIRRNGNKAEKSMDELMREAKAALEKEGIYGVDPNFRLFTAMNPERYAGRNRLSLAMRNKLSEIWISGEMSDAEYEKIIGGYLADNPEKKNMVKAMVKLHQGMQYVIEYLEGGTIDKYQFSMRDIKAWAGYINRYGKRLGWTEAFAKGALYFYYERMTTKGDKDKFMEWFEDVIGKASYQQASKCAKALLGRRISDEQKKAIVAGGRVPILDIPLETNKSPKEKELVPKLETARLVHTASTVKDLEKIAQAADLNDPLLLVGETGAGKTSLVRYLAYLTNNSFQRLNLSGQTEKMDFIGGYYPEENGRFVWRDGALINAMRNGQWLVIDEINLAPSQVIERLNSLLDDDGFLVVTEHRAEKYVRKPEYDKRLSAYAAEIKGQDACSDQEALARAKQRLDDESIYPIDPNFRIFATMNPSEYAGRQAFSPALLNRFRVKWIDEPSGSDVAVIMKEKYKGKIDERLINKAIRVHYEMLKEIRNVSGTTTHYTIRHLTRWMDRLSLGLKEDPGYEPNKMAFLDGAAVYGDGFSGVLAEATLKNRLKELLIAEFGDYGSKENMDISLGVDSVNFGDVRLGIRKEERRFSVSGPELFDTSSMKGQLSRLARAVRANDKALLVGLTGGGKSELARYISDLTNNDFMALDLDGQTDVAQLIGQYVPLEGTDKYEWKDGSLVKAMKEGCWILIDEINLAEPEIIERLNSLLDDDASLTINEHHGEKWIPARIYDDLESEGHDMSGLRRINENFRVFCAMNPEYYAGRARMSIAMLNKFYQLWIPQEGSFEEERAITSHYIASEAPLTASAVSADSAGQLIRKETGLAEARSRFANHGVYLGMNGAGAIMLLSDTISGLWKYYKEKREAGRTGAGFAAQYFKEDAKGGEENLGWFEKMKRSIKKEGVNRRLKKVEFMSQFYSGDFNMSVKPGAGWAVNYDTQQPTLIYPEEDLIDKSAEYIAGATMHEACHRDITWVDEFFFSKESRRFLLNAVEDPRVNNWGMLKVPGSRKYFDALYKEAYPVDKKGFTGAVASMPHIQFGLGLIHHWYYGKEHPAIKDKAVLDALEKTRDAAVEAYNTLAGAASITRYDEKRILVDSPGLGKKIMELPAVGSKPLHFNRPDIQRLRRVDKNTLEVVTQNGQEEITIPDSNEKSSVILNLRPSVEDKRRAAEIATQIVRDKILPEYEKLVQESVDNMKDQASKRSGGGISDSEAQSQGEGSVESASKEWADKLGGKIPMEEKKKEDINKKKRDKSGAGAEKPEEDKTKPEEEGGKEGKAEDEDKEGQGAKKGVSGNKAKDEKGEGRDEGALPKNEGANEGSGQDTGTPSEGKEGSKSDTFKENMHGKAGGNAGKPVTTEPDKTEPEEGPDKSRIE